jgi:AcrR family transcriptional regulator
MSSLPVEPTAGDERPAGEPGEVRLPETLGPPRGRFARRLPSGRHGLPRAFVVRNQRERVLDAAAQAVAEKGYTATRVADITEGAGVSRKTFYELFSDKEDCFLAAFDTVANLLFKQVAQAYEDDADVRPWRERIRAGLETFLNLLAAEPAFARMCLVEARYAGPHALARLEAGKRTFMSYLRAGREQPEAAEDIPEKAEELLIGGMYDMIERRVLAGEAATLPELAASFMAFVDRIYFGGP